MQDLFGHSLIPTLGILIIVFVFYLAFKKENSKSIEPKTKLARIGNTPTLNAFSIDFTTLAEQKKIDPVIGREEEIRRLTQVLIRKNKNNVILIGDPGVGKTAIVEGFAVRIVEGNVPEILRNKRVFALEVAKLLSDTKYRGEFEKRIRKILEEIERAGRSIILFIDEVHSIVQSHGTEGSVNFADILKPALARGDLQMIGATTTAEYEKYIKSNPSLERRFQPIEVPQPTVEQTIKILQGVKDKYRTYHKVEFTDAAIKAAAEISAKEVHNRTLPDKAIDAIDEAAAMIKVSHIHKAIPAILFQAATQKNPKIYKVWSKIQTLDQKSLQGSNKTKLQPNLDKEREKLEKELEDTGIITIDSDDIKKIIAEWTKR